MPSVVNISNTKHKKAFFERFLPYFIQDLSDVVPRGPQYESEQALRASFPPEWRVKFSEDELVKSQTDVGDVMAEDVRREMVHCWRGYREKAWGHDEVRPVTGGHHDWVAIGISILDTIDTIWLMGMTKEFEEAKHFVAHELDYDKRRGGHQSTFEITIRALGGLVSAYSLSGDEVFLKSAKDLGDRLMRAFATDSGLPKPQIDLVGGSSKWSNWSPNTNIAEVATLQMEFRQLGSSL